ncbi:MAG TPA: queuosine precursor transporter [Candidatus Saccharimonadales bacterium]|jgi:hypothetical protein
MKNQYSTAFQICAALYVTILIVSNIASVKIVSIGPAVFDAGTILFPFAYILIGIINEVYGFKRLRQMLYIGIGMLLLTSLVFWIVGILPAAADWSGQSSYDATLGVVFRIIFASITAIAAGEFFSGYVQNRLKERLQGKYLWGRIIGASGLGSLVDTIIFSVIAFAGTMSGSTLLQLMATVWCIKLLVELVVSPITLRVIKELKKVEIASD